MIITSEVIIGHKCFTITLFCIINDCYDFMRKKIKITYFKIFIMTLSLAAAGIKILFLRSIAGSHRTEEQEVITSIKTQKIY